MNYRRYEKNKAFSKRKSPIRKIILGLGVLLLIFGAVFLGIKYTKNYKGLPGMKTVYADWNEKNYISVYDKTEQILKKRPYDGEVLALRGFAAYYIFVEKTDFSTSYEYLDEAILCLRQALYRVKKSEKPKISYVLGKAYYQKGYYYSDLAVKYLDYTANAGLEFEDLAEFRGMSASLLGEPDKAISAFSEALAYNPSDLLLFALAKNYMKICDEQNSKLYLFETINKTNDALLELKCRYLLGSILLDEGKISEAEKEFKLILDKDRTSADAYYGLGVVAEIRGDLIKARAEWRKALKLDPLHEKTRIKLDLK